MPEGFSDHVQFLASGDTPGLLQPGESGRVPIYYAGWQKPWDMSYPPFQWSLGVLSAENGTPVDWAAMKEEMRPPYVGTGLWDVLWSNFTGQAGSTWGDYVAMLGRNAVYLNRLGQRVEDLDKLLAFSLLRADGLNPASPLAGNTDSVIRAPGFPSPSAGSMPSLFPEGTEKDLLAGGGHISGN